MRNIKEQENLRGKIVLLRLDLNVPLKNSHIVDETRINKILPIINFLIKKEVRIVVISHVGRPGGKEINDLSLKPICENLEKKLNKKVKLITTNIKNLEKRNLFLDKTYEIVVLENIRFYKEEETNEYEFSKHLASLGDLYVNDAFSCSHRNHASVCKITEFIPSFAGIQFESEISALKKITSDIKKPISCIIGGSKISTKINLIKNLVSKFNNIIFVGGMANNILYYKGFDIGKSLKEENCEKIVQDIFYTAEKYSCSIYFPDDVCVGKSLDSNSQVRSLDQISEDEMILDIGPNTIKNILSIINTSKTVFWNGPAGYFENENFFKGSSDIAKAIANKSKNNMLFSVAGGGDTIAVINKTQNLENFNFVSTAGGAFLEYLEGKQLPGIKALN